MIATFAITLILGVWLKLVYRKRQTQSCLTHGHKWQETPEGYYCPRCQHRMGVGDHL
jgi:Zn finger protein HypA/HybF involved in hydrogenase expression